MNVSWRRREGDLLADPVFPESRLLLDTVAVAAALRELATVPWRPGLPSELVDVYYYPGRTLQAVHRLPDGRVVTLYARPALGEPAVRGVAVPGLGADALTFPTDPGLPSLPSVLAEVGDPFEVFAYLPGRRVVLGAPDRVAKVGPADDVARAHRRQAALWSMPGRPFRMAQPLGHDPDRAVRWERRLPGVRVEDQLGTAPPGRLAKLVAAQLAGLHGLPPTMWARLELPVLPAAALLSRLEHKTVRTVSRVLPGLAPRCSAVAAQLRAMGPPARGPDVAVHGDFHIANLLIDGDTVVLLDLDEMGRGDPELDLALFASRVLLVAMHRGDDTAAAGTFADELCDAYADVTGRRIDRATFAWYLAACLVGRQVKTCIRHLAPDLAEVTGALVTAAEEVLATPLRAPASLSRRAG